VLTLEELLIYLDKVDPRPHAGELNGNEPGSSFVFVAAAPTVQSLTAPSEMSGQLKVRVTPAGSNISLTPVDNVRTLIIEPVEEVGQVATFLIPTGRYRLKVTKVGHETVEAEVMVSEQPQTVNIVMSPRP
ncbi:MAG: hypothetical protein HN463_13565, partial [Gemmatimonadales bacterium]|nr:hypothetical protein [Gemmatimonadales bacterium]